MCLKVKISDKGCFMLHEAQCGVRKEYKKNASDITNSIKQF